MNEVSVVKRLDGPAARERLAAYAHDAWVGWMKCMFVKCEKNDDGEIVIPRWAYERWTRQAYTAYPDLPDSEKESGRLEADRILEILDRIPLERGRA